MTRTAKGHNRKMIVVTAVTTDSWYDLSTHPPKLGNPEEFKVYNPSTNPGFQNNLFPDDASLCYKYRFYFRNTDLAASLF